MSDEERLGNPGDLPEEPAAEPPIDLPVTEEMGEVDEATEEISETAPEGIVENDVPTADEPVEFQLPKGPIEPPTVDSEAMDSTDDDRLMAALAWFSMVILQLPIISVILLLVEPNKHQPFQRYHSVTSTLFYVAAFIYEILAAIAFAILSRNTRPVCINCV